MTSRLARTIASVPLLVLALGCAGAAPGSAESPGSGSAADGAGASNANAEYPQYAIPGTSTRLRLPDGFTRPARDARLVHEELGIVASLIELHVSSSEANETLEGVRAGMQEKLEVESESSVERASGATGFVVRGRREDHFASAAALTLEGIVAVVLLIHSPSSADAVAAILASMEIDPSAKFDPLAAHGLALGEMAGLEPVYKTLAPMMFFEQGVEVPVPPDAAVMSIAVIPVPEVRHPDDRMAGAALAGVLKAFSPDLEHVESSELQVDGTEATEVVTRGTDNGQPIAVYGAALSDPYALLTFFGKVGAQRHDRYIPRFRKLVESLRRSKPPLEAVQPAGR